MKFIKETLLTTIGCGLMALGIVMFLLPNRLSSGGFSGIATVLYYIFGAQIGTTTLLMNIPLFIIAYMKLGKKFFVKALIRNSNIIISLKCFWEHFC